MEPFYCRFRGELCDIGQRGLDRGAFRIQFFSPPPSSSFYPLDVPSSPAGSVHVEMIDLLSACIRFLRLDWGAFSPAHRSPPTSPDIRRTIHTIATNTPHCPPGCRFPAPHASAHPDPRLNRRVGITVSPPFFKSSSRAARIHTVP